MKLLTIIVYANGKEIGRCHYSSLEEKATGSERIFTFKNLRISSPCTVSNSGYDYLNFSLYMKVRSGKTLELSKMKLLPSHTVHFEQDGDVSLRGHLVPDRNIDSYHQYEIDVLHAWSEGWELDWRSPMISPEQKEAILAMRGKYNGLPQSIRKQTGTLDGGQIYHHEDFYLSLGEVVMGDRGWFGSTYDSLHDCLIECRNHGAISFQLNISGSEQIRKVLMKEYFEDILDLLRESGFGIQIKE